MKVFFLTNIPSPYRVAFFNELGKLCDLTVLFEDESPLHRNTEWLSKNFENFEGIFLKKRKITHSLGICLSVIKFLKANRYDHIVIGGYSTPTGMLAIEYCKLNKIPFILNTDGGFISKENFIKFVTKRHFIKAAHWWLTTGEITTDYLLHYGAKKEFIFSYPFTSIMKKDIIQINDIDTNRYKKLLGIENKPLIIAVGSLLYGKGFDVLLKSMKDLTSNYNLIILGEGKEKSALEAQCNELKLKNVRFIGFVQPYVLSNYYKAADLFILPTRQDVWGLVINEAMAHGLSVITTNKCIAGLELIENGINGFIVNVDDVKDLSKKIMRIFEDLELKNYMSRNNLKKIEEYTIERMALSTFNILKEI